MSYQFFSEAEILQASTLAQTGVPQASLIEPSFLESVDLSSLTTTHAFGPTEFHPESAGEAFTYKAELTNAYLEKGHITYTDQWNAERQASLHGFQSDAAFDGMHEPPSNEAERYIQEASLLKSYNENGHLQMMDGWEASYKAQLQAPLEQYKFEGAIHMELTPGGEFIRDANIIDSYNEGGTWDYSDIYSAEMHGLAEGPGIDWLF